MATPLCWFQLSTFFFLKPLYLSFLRLTFITALRLPPAPSQYLHLWPARCIRLFTQPLQLVGCAPERRDGQRGESPLRANALRPVAKSNCVAARRGGEQQEANDQSVGRRTRFGLARVASLHPKGEAWTAKSGEPVELRGSVTKLRQDAPDDWRRKGQEGQSRKSGRPVRVSAGVHAIKRESVYRPKSRANRSQSAHSSEEA